MRSAPQIAVTHLGHLPPPTPAEQQKGKDLLASTQSSSGGTGAAPLGSLSTIHHAGGLAPTPCSRKLFPANYSKKNRKVPWRRGTSSTQLGVYGAGPLQCFGCAEQGELKKPQIPLKSAPGASANNWVEQQQLWGLFCFAVSLGESIWELKKKNHLLHTCCSPSSKQFAVAWQPP